MNIYGILTGAFNLLATGILGGMVFARQPNDPRARTFGWAAVCIVGWSAAYIMWLRSGNEIEALWWARMLSAWAVMIPVFYFRFVRVLVAEPPRLEERIGFYVSCGFALLSFSPLIVDRMEPRVGVQYWPVAGMLHPVYLVVFGWFTMHSIFLLWRGFRTATGRAHNQLRYVAVYSLVGFAGGATNFLAWYGWSVPPWGNPLVGGYMVGVGYVVIRYRLLPFSLAMARALSYSLVILGLTAILVAPVVFTHQMANPWVELTAISVLSMLLIGMTFTIGPRWRARLDAFLEQKMVPVRVDRRRAIQRLSKRLWLQSTEAELAEVVVGGLDRAFRATPVGFYRKVADGHWERVQVNDAAAAWPVLLEDAELLVGEAQREGGVFVDDGRLAESASSWVEAREYARRCGFHVAAVVQVGADPVAMVILGAFLQRDGWFGESDELGIKHLCSQLGSILNAKQIERRVNQLEKLVSLGTLAAGIAHEVRNPLVSIRTFCELSEAGDQEYALELAPQVRKDVDRIAGVVDNVAALAADQEVHLSHVDLATVAMQAVEAVQQSHGDAAGCVRIVGEEHIRVRGNASQLVQVVVNLLTNAIDAVGAARVPEPVIEVALEAGEMATLAVRDNGPGFDPDVLPRIFEAFFSTKACGALDAKSGMGLGLAIVRVVVQGHNGEVAAGNRPDGGGVVRVMLPLDTADPGESKQEESSW